MNIQDLATRIYYVCPPHFRVCWPWSLLTRGMREREIVFTSYILAVIRCIYRERKSVRRPLKNTKKSFRSWLGVFRRAAISIVSTVGIYRAGVLWIGKRRSKESANEPEDRQTAQELELGWKGKRRKEKEEIACDWVVLSSWALVIRETSR